MKLPCCCLEGGHEYTRVRAEELGWVCDQDGSTIVELPVTAAEAEKPPAPAHVAGVATERSIAAPPSVVAPPPATERSIFTPPPAAAPPLAAIPDQLLVSVGDLLASVRQLLAPAGARPPVAVELFASVHQLLASVDLLPPSGSHLHAPVGELLVSVRLLLISVTGPRSGADPWHASVGDLLSSARLLLASIDGGHPASPPGH